jgi:hypothetical protein
VSAHSGSRAGSEWAAHPPYFLACVEPVIPASITASMPRVNGLTHLALEDLRQAVRLEAEPTASGTWLIRLWAASAEQSPEAIALSLAVTRASEPPVLVQAITTGDALGEISDSERTNVTGPLGFDASYQMALWRLFRRAMAHARTLADTAELRRRLPGLDVDYMGGSAPFQVEGAWHGYAFYFRYRYDTVRLQVGAGAGGQHPLWIAELTEAESAGFHGALSVDEFTQLFLRLASQLQRAPFIYLFKPTSPEVIAREGPWQSAGHSAESALALLRERVRDLRHDSYLDMEIEFDDTPVNEDLRVFPDQAPPFAPEVSE